MTEKKPIRLLSVDDHPLVREGIVATIATQPDMALVHQTENGKDAIAAFRTYQPDVTLMDLRLPDMTGIEATIAILKEFSGARIMMLTTFERDVEVQRALEAGVRGYVLKTMPPKELILAIRSVHAGQKHVPPELALQLAEHYGEKTLTAREIEILKHIAAGNRNRRIAERLFISEETVKVHIKHIMEKLQASDRTQAVTIGIRRGIVQL